ncbi:hypothetical protein NDR87_16450 [Nocardia sp. CDC159]|uniref:Uncharacterized protein n=1 Tax=Nocardia pulmonis TaxID=2951408 RepID=A0A9X2IYU2_9NOCA|nr:MULTISPECIES: hypothetical protein [Nocardia]MCM6775315.1 hypothetical protein [Nocardia pulmonis]MCM6787951.1 hypothetical protein [Nocardia sp. CDC159]
MMIVRPQAAPVSPREEAEAIDDAVVWPDPSPLASWWAQVMQAPSERRAGSGKA